LKARKAHRITVLVGKGEIGCGVTDLQSHGRA